MFVLWCVCHCRWLHGQCVCVMLVTEVCHCFNVCSLVCLSLSMATWAVCMCHVSDRSVSLFQHLFSGVSITVDGYMGSVYVPCW